MQIDRVVGSPVASALTSIKDALTALRTKSELAKLD
jgi:hypothetical protein